MSSVIDLANRHRAPRSGLLPKLAFGFGMLILLGVLFGPSFFAHLRLYSAQYSDDYYALYLDSGNVFYGQIRGVGLGQITLTNAYSFQSIEVGETSTSNLSAVRNNPLTRPDNWMVINRDHVLFYERIGDDASILEALRAQ